MSKLGALNKNTYPTKIIYAPGFIVGGLVFFFQNGLVLKNIK